MKCDVIGNIGGSAVLCHLTAFLLLFFPQTVRSQCERGDEENCRWSNEEGARVKWITETKSGESYIRLKCTKPCGSGTISSPWLPPNTSPNQLVLYFKLYGYSDVYFKLEQKKENENLPKTLYKKTANYGDPFPEQWSTAKINIPTTDTTYRLILKAHTPFSDGFVGLKGIAINDPNVIISPPISSSTPTPTTTTRRVATPSSTITPTTEGNDIEFPDDDDEPEGSNSNGMSEALEDRRFLSVEDFNFGRTTVVYPELCKY